jgi:hypothetical protein
MLRKPRALRCCAAPGGSVGRGTPPFSSIEATLRACAGQTGREAAVASQRAAVLVKRHGCADQRAERTRLQGFGNNGARGRLR